MSKLFSDFIHSLMPATSSIGIEITDTSIKMAELCVTKNGSPLIPSFDMEFLKDKVVDDGRILDAVSAARAIQTLYTRLNTKTKTVHMVLPSQSIMVRFLKLPDIPVKDLAKLVEFEIKHNIHLPFEQPIFDYVKLNGTNKKAASTSDKPAKHRNRTIEPVNDAFAQAAASRESGLGLSGIDDLFGDKASADPELPTDGKTQCDVMLVAAPRALVDEYMNVVQVAGLKVKSLEIKALSLYRIIETTRFTEPGSTFLIVDINEKATDISIFHDGMLKITRNVPIPFNTKPNVTEIASNVDHIFADFADPDADFRNACNDLAHELERLMNFYRYSLNHREHEFQKILLSGDTAKFTEIAQSLAQVLSLEIVPFYTDRIRVRHMLFEQLFPMYAVPIGLAMRGRQE